MIVGLPKIDEYYIIEIKRDSDGNRMLDANQIDSLTINYNFNNGVN